MNSKLFSAALLACGVASAASPVDGWYGSGFGGFNYLPDNIFAANAFGTLFNRTSYHNGYDVGGRLGYQSHPIRYEIEYTYLTATNSGFAINWVPQTAGLTGNTSGNIGMANLYYDCPDFLPAISPFVGVGIGYGSLQIKLVSTMPNGGGFLGLTENTFMYQATIGLTYNFAENYAFNASYRYLASSQSNAFGRIYQVDIVNVAVIYRFDQGTYK